MFTSDERPIAQAGRARSCAHCPTGHSRRGTALVEFVMCIPLLATVIAATFFLGWGMKNQQHVKVSDRYKAWREIRAPGERVSGDELNQRLFYNRADAVDLERQSGYYLGGHDEFNRNVRDRVDTETEAFVGDLIIDQWPHSLRVRVSASFPFRWGAMFAEQPGYITHWHGRIGVEWRRGQIECHNRIRQFYLNDLDGAIGSVQAPGQNLAAMARRLYRNGW